MTRQPKNASPMDMQPLAVHEITRPAIFPIESIVGTKSLRAGVLDAHGEPIRDSLLFRRRRGVESQIIFPASFHERPRRIAGSAIYMGPLFDHFGHFLLESLARTWYALENPTLPIVWSVSKTGVHPSYRRWQSDLLELVGIRNPPLFAAEAVTVDKLFVPAPGYRIQDYFHPQLRDSLAFAIHEPKPGRYTWLSRSRLPQKGNRTAALLDERLAAAGWDVVYPETVSISEQIARLASSERIAGEQGSALHLLLFLKDAGRLRVDVFDRDQDLPMKSRNRNYETIANAKAINQVNHRCDFERFIGRRGAEVEKIGQNSFLYLEKLGVGSMNFGSMASSRESSKHGQPPSSITVARLKALAQYNAATRYLEIGVADGRTFLHLDFATRHAVDPKFRFDTRNYEGENCRFFEMTSDDYFVQFANKNCKYDLIFLDGLHTFEQTFRDFCSTQSHRHDKTLWLIDDVYPSDPFSAVPVESRSREYRRVQSGSGKGPWHGDVYKTIFAIHDLFPNLSYRTVVGNGNPQTVVLPRPRTNFKPRFQSLGEITELSYFDFLDIKELLNPINDEELLEWVKLSG